MSEGRLRMARIRWMALELRAVGNTDQIGTKRTRPGLDIVLR